MTWASYGILSIASNHNSSFRYTVNTTTHTRAMEPTQPVKLKANKTNLRCWRQQSVWNTFEDKSKVIEVYNKKKAKKSS